MIYNAIKDGKIVKSIIAEPEFIAGLADGFTYEPVHSPVLEKSTPPPESVEAKLDRLIAALEKAGVIDPIK